VRFCAAGRLIGEDDEAPYTASTSITPAHPLTAMNFSAAAVDSAGNVGPLVRLNVLAETSPTIDSIDFGPGASAGAWGIDEHAYVNFHAAAMPSGNTSRLNYLASAQLSIDGVVRDTATPGAARQDAGVQGNCQLGCAFAAEDTSGYGLVPLTAADAGWHDVWLRVTDVNVATAT